MEDEVEDGCEDEDDGCSTGEYLNDEFSQSMPANLNIVSSATREMAGNEMSYARAH